MASAIYEGFGRHTGRSAVQTDRARYTSESPGPGGVSGGRFAIFEVEVEETREVVKGSEADELVLGDPGEVSEVASPGALDEVDVFDTTSEDLGGLRGGPEEARVTAGQCGTSESLKSASGPSFFSGPPDGQSEILFLGSNGGCCP